MAKIEEGVEQTIVNEAIRIGTVIILEDDPVRLGKLNGALNLLNIALSVIGSDPSRANKLLSMARNISRI